MVRLQICLAQVEQLKQENQTLTVANTDLTTQRDTLTAQKARVEQNLATTRQKKLMLKMLVQHYMHPI